MIARIDAARARGQRITPTCTPTTPARRDSTPSMPPWVQEGGLEQWRKRLQDPPIRERVAREMRTPADDWENLMMLAGGADNVLLSGFKSDALKPLTGKRLGAVARMRGKSPEETAMDLVVEDDSRIEAIYFIINEDNIRKQIRLPYVSFGSDAAASAPEGVFLKSSNHPREYGNFANLLGRYVRDEKIIPLEEAIRRMTSLPPPTFTSPIAVRSSRIFRRCRRLRSRHDRRACDV